jgi:hypothetical protein
MAEDFVSPAALRVDVRLQLLAFFVGGGPAASLSPGELTSKREVVLS